LDAPPVSACRQWRQLEAAPAKQCLAKVEAGSRAEAGAGVVVDVSAKSVSGEAVMGSSREPLTMALVEWAKAL
jgi:hypothetical protein